MFRRLVFLLAVMGIALFGYRAVQAAALPTIASLDFDNNGAADFTVFRPAEGKFFVLQGPRFTSALSITSSSASSATDTILPGADYNGDGKIDAATYRPATLGPSALAGTWTIQLGQTFTTAMSVDWGTTGDLPIPGDWDGDGRTDVAVYRPFESKLYVLQAGSNYTTAFSVAWGAPGDTAFTGDFDGDGRLDFACFRPTEGRVFILQGGFTRAFSVVFGLANHTWVPGDYDGDGRTDLATYTPATLGPSNVVGTWTVFQAGTGYTTQFAVTWGTTGDTPVPGDYDGDGRLDMAVYRPTELTYFVLQGGSGFTRAFSVAWGTTGDTLLSVRTGAAF